MPLSNRPRRKASSSYTLTRQPSNFRNDPPLAESTGNFSLAAVLSNRVCNLFGISVPNAPLTAGMCSSPNSRGRRSSISPSQVPHCPSLRRTNLATSSYRSICSTSSPATDRRTLSASTSSPSSCATIKSSSAMSHSRAETCRRRFLSSKR